MTDQRLKDAFSLGAGMAAPSPELWQRVEAEIGRRTAARRLRRRNWAALAAAVLIFCSLLSLSPGARVAVAGAVNQVLTLWQSRFGDTPVQVSWEPRTPAVEEQYTFEAFPDAAALAGYLGFDPVLSGPPGTLPTRFQGHRGVEPSGKDVRVARVEYNLAGAPFAVETAGFYTPQGEQIPQTELTIPLITPEAPTKVWEEAFSQRTAVCMEWTQPGWKVAACSFLQDGFRVIISGPDFRGVSRLATFLAE